MGVNRSNGSKSIEGKPLRDHLLQAIVPGDLQGSVFKFSKPGLRTIGRTETADEGGVLAVLSCLQYCLLRVTSRSLLTTTNMIYLEPAV